jgi:hypothetical protein
MSSTTQEAVLDAIQAAIDREGGSSGLAGEIATLSEDIAMNPDDFRGTDDDDDYSADIRLQVFCKTGELVSADPDDWAVRLNYGDPSFDLDHLGWCEPGAAWTQRDDDGSIIPMEDSDAHEEAERMIDSILDQVAWALPND